LSKVTDKKHCSDAHSFLAPARSPKFKQNLRNLCNLRMLLLVFVFIFSIPSAAFMAPLARHHANASRPTETRCQKLIGGWPAILSRLGEGGGDKSPHGFCLSVFAPERDDGVRLN
jgi:hypothetical protein